MIYSHITELIGNTPLLRIDPNVHGLTNVDLYAKLEFYNPFGSIKDRIAWGMLKDYISDIKNTNKTIIESSSGNTAKGLAGIANTLNIPLKVITNRIKVPEVKKILRLLGVDIEELPGMSECPDPNDPNDMLTHLEKEIATDPQRYFHPSQYTNPQNVQTHYSTTGEEIINDLGQVDYLFAGLGTTGSSRGAGTYIKEKSPQSKVIGVVASKGDYIPGIRNTDELFEVGLYKKDFYDDHFVVDSLSAVNSMLDLIKKCGILCGPTSGAVYNASLTYLKNIPDSKDKIKAVFIVCDRVEWYISYIEKRRPELFETNVKPKVLSQTAAAVSQAPQISPAAAFDLIGKSNVVIIDIRGNYAYKTFHLPASINIPESIFADLIESGPVFPKDRGIIVACPHGDQSKKFSSYLNVLGYAAYSLEGGIISWRQQGLPMESSL